MMETDRLIHALTADLKPVRTLAPAWRRTAIWLAVGVPAVALFAVAMGPRPDLAEKWAEPLFAAQQILTVLTAVAGAWAALSAVVPGTPPWVFWTPAVPLAAWLASLGRQCWQEWATWGAGGMTFAIDLECVPGIVLLGTVPAVAMVAMIRRGAPLHASAAVFWGTLASAALANAGLRIFHAPDAALMVIVWQFGTVLAITLAAMLVKGRLVPFPGAVKVGA